MPAFAQEGPAQGFDLGINTGVTWSDNIRLAPDNERSGTIGQVGVDLAYAQQTRRLRTDLNVNTAYQHYFDDEFDADVVGGGDGTLVIALAPQRFEWLIQDNFAQARVDPESVSTPDNRQNINFLTTGPDLMFRLGQRNSMRLSGRYSRSDFELTGFDDERYLVGLSIARQLGRITALSLNVQGEELEFEDELLSESGYDRREAFIRLDAVGSRTTLSTSVGYSEIEGVQQSNDLLVASFRLQRKVGASSTLNVDIGRNFSDSGNLLRQSQARNGVTLDPTLVISSSDALEHRFAIVGWGTTFSRTSLGAVVEYDAQRYENVAALDRDYLRYSAYGTRRMRPNLQARAELRYSEEEFDNSAYDAQERRVSLAMEWNASARVTLNFQYDFIDRSSSVSFTEYTDNRFSVFVAWRPLAQR